MVKKFKTLKIIAGLAFFIAVTLLGFMGCREDEAATENNAKAPDTTSTYAVTMQNDGNGTAAASPASAAAGTLVTVSATPNSGFRFKEWQVVSGSVTLSSITTSPATFTMPASVVTIKAVFESLPPNTPNLTLSPSPVSFSVTYGYSLPSAQTVTINNSGTGIATVTNITLGGANASSFTLAGHSSITSIAASGNATFTVRPNTTGLTAGTTRNATITVTYDGAATATTGVSFAVSKATGAAVVVPTGSGTTTRITVGAVSLLTATGQSVEYNISKQNNGTGFINGTWQTDTTFRYLTANTTYYIYARSASNTNYNAGTASVSADITTATFSPMPSVEMVTVTGGAFMMGKSGDGSGSPYANETNPHLVTVSNFNIGKYPITQAQYKAVMGTNPSYFTTANGRPPVGTDVDANRPVDTICWYDAVEFCNALSVIDGRTPYYTINTTVGSDPNNNNTSDPYKWLVTNTTANGYRLPTEAEWEFAAKGGNATYNGLSGFGTETYYVFSGSDTIGDVAWYSGNSSGSTREVGTRAGNELGIYDMCGNVFEWCWDWRGAYTAGAVSNPTGASSGVVRILRGGRFSTVAEPVSFRYANGPDETNNGYGIRVVCP